MISHLLRPPSLIIIIACLGGRTAQIVKWILVHCVDATAVAVAAAVVAAVDTAVVQVEKD